jgi:hypothetical protein
MKKSESLDVRKFQGGETDTFIVAYRRRHEISFEPSQRGRAICETRTHPAAGSWSLSDGNGAAFPRPSPEAEPASGRGAA